jgi:FtsP/CotA-like multicopper oxidase with cupredoxin domain
VRFLRNAYFLRALAAVGAVLLVAAAGVVAWSWNDSRLPSTYSAMEFAPVDYGGGTAHAHHAKGHVSVEQLTGPRTGTPDYRITLVARKAEIRLASGRRIDAWTFNGRVPGPEIRVRQGDLVEATLVNEDIDDGVTIHWHGVDVPNAEDGVAGVTQNAVMPGERYTYRFRAEQLGTFWYHSHQVSSEQVRRGLYGGFVILPRTPPAGRAVDLTTIAHDFGSTLALGVEDGVAKRPVAPGTPVRLRLVNSNNTPERFVLTGTPFRVVGIDGTEVNGPTPIAGRALNVGGGARYDVAFDMPAGGVRLGVEGSSAALVLGRSDELDSAQPSVGLVFDPARYGRPRPTSLGSTTRWDRSFVLDIGRRIGFIDGRPGYHWSINGKLYPETPMYIVRPGDRVKMTIRNRTGKVHPMHLHGHHLLVLSRDGKPVTGSPWWVDTLNVLADEDYVVAFRADNPGIWMDHCHNLKHARDGLTMHVAYEGVTTPFRLGDGPENHPE